MSVDELPISFNCFLVLVNLDEVQLSKSNTEKSYKRMHRVTMNTIKLSLPLVAEPVMMDAATKILESTPVKNEVAKHKFLLKTTYLLEHALLTRRTEIMTRIVEKIIDPQCYNLF